jgi:dihydroxyacid dehydratase/phosphogluconate dehydratase
MGHDGMRSSLPSSGMHRRLVELTVRGHAYDALVGLRRLRQVAARG